MTYRPLRFLHASDLHLDRVGAGLEDVGDELAPVLIDAPYRAAQRIFDLAISEKVDFLLFAGDSVDPLAAGPRGLVFLIDQCTRLVERSVAVYVLLGPHDPSEEQISSVDWPENVHFFPRNRMATLVHERGGRAVAQIIGMSTDTRRRIRTSDYETPIGDCFNIAVAYGLVDDEAAAQLGGHGGIDYWALGGEHGRRTPWGGDREETRHAADSHLSDSHRKDAGKDLLSKESRSREHADLAHARWGVVHYPGTPQGRRMRESGPHGCTLVQVDENGRPRLTFLTCDALRWHSEDVHAGGDSTRDALERALVERARAIAAAHAQHDVLVRYSVVTGGRLAQQLRSGILASDLLSRLRAEFQGRRPAVWSLSLEVDEQDRLADVLTAELVREESLLGEYLRAIDHFAANPHLSLGIDRYVGERTTGVGPGVLDLSDPKLRARVLRDAALLGVDLLGPDAAG